MCVDNLYCKRRTFCCLKAKANLMIWKFCSLWLCVVFKRVFLLAVGSVSSSSLALHQMSLQCRVRKADSSCRWLYFSATRGNYSKHLMKALFGMIHNYFHTHTHTHNVYIGIYLLFKLCTWKKCVVRPSNYKIDMIVSMKKRANDLMSVRSTNTADVLTLERHLWASTDM